MTLHHVDPGPEADLIRVNEDIDLIKVSVGPMDNNAYLIRPEAGPAILVDAAAEPGRLKALVGDDEVGAVITTHRHSDHTGALADVIAATGAQPWCGKPDAEAIEASTGVTCRTVWDGDLFRLGDIELDVIGLVGHTRGSIALRLRGNPSDHILTGDSLFPGGPGRVQNDTQFATLMADLEKKVFGVYNDETVIWPGHGLPTTLGAERPHLGEWRERGW